MLKVILFITLWLLLGCEVGSRQRPKSTESNPPEIRGYDSVVFGTEGGKVTVTGFIDSKFVCPDINESQRDICTTALVGNSNEQKSMQIQLRVCNEQLKRNCIAENVPGQDARRHWVFVYDNNSELIDFDGCRVIEEPNTWYCDSTQLNFTGTVAVKDGRGYFAGSVDRIAAFSR